MNLNVLGPLLFATMLFLVSAAIKLLGFGDVEVFWELAPELALWATGILFAISVSEQTQFRGSLAYEYKRKPSGAGFEVDYKVLLPERLDFSAKYLYLFVCSFSIYVLTVLLSAYAIDLQLKAHEWTNGTYVFNLIGLGLAGITVGVAIRSLFELSS